MNIFQQIKQVLTPSAQSVSADDTSNFVSSKEEFEQFRTIFKHKAQNKQIKAIDILLYNIMRGVDLERGFTPITNQRKLDNGEKAYHGQRSLFESRHSLKWHVGRFERTQQDTYIESYKLTPKTCANIIKLL